MAQICANHIKIHQTFKDPAASHVRPDFPSNSTSINTSRAGGLVKDWVCSGTKQNLVVSFSQLVVSCSNVTQPHPKSCIICAWFSLFSAIVSSNDPEQSVLEMFSITVYMYEKDIPANSEKPRAFNWW